MKCSKCKGEMEKGELRGDPKWGITFYPKKRTSIFGGDFKLFVYRCPKCGKIEIYSETKGD